MNERDIFLVVLDLPDPAARAAYLDSACGGDSDLRTRVESLLQAHDDAGNFLDAPVVTAPQPDALATLASSEERSGPQANPEDEALTFLGPPGRPDSLGRIGHYEVLEVLGRGGFGIVFRAFDETLQRVVAVKVLAPQVAATSPARKRFLREARASARVRHENVVQVYAVEEQPLPYLVMEFIPGETLQQRLDRTGPLEMAEVVRIGGQIAEGLAAAHETGLIHRDIKPGNILIETRSQHVKITDFGLARAADDASLTQSGIVAGTPMFMSPEQARGEAIDHRSDLFSLGSVLYTMCSGRPPFRANSALAVLKRVAEDTPRPIQEIIPEVPTWLCAIISRLHAKKPEDRFDSAREVADLLARCLAELQQHGTVRSVPTAKTPALAGRSPRRRWIIVAALLLLVFGLGMSEATGVSNLRGTVVGLFTPEGILVLAVDEPGVVVTLDGEELTLPQTGAREFRLKPGRYAVKTSKDGTTLSEETVRIERNGTRLVRVRRDVPAPETKGDAAAWEKSVASLSPEEQVKAVAVRLKKLNGGFDGEVTHTIEKDVVVGLRFSTVGVTDISPVRALGGLKSLSCGGVDGEGNLADLTPLKGMQLTILACNNTRVASLAPLRGMQFRELALQHTSVSDLMPLADMPLEHLNCSHTRVASLEPLKGMKLVTLYLDDTKVTDLSPLKGMPLKLLNCRSCNLHAKRAGDTLRSLAALEEVNSDPVADFLKKLDAEKPPDSK